MFRKTPLAFVCYCCSSTCLRTSPQANDWISAVDTGVTPTNEDTRWPVAHVRRCSKKAFVGAWGVSRGLFRACYRSDTSWARAAPPFPHPSSTVTSGSPPPLTFRAVSVDGVDAAPSASSPWWVVVLPSQEIEPGAGGDPAVAAALLVVRRAYSSLKDPLVA